MSFWTYVNGSIRYDAFRSPEYSIDTLKKLLDENIPCGSKGPLQYSIWENPEKTSFARYTVSIFGDLMDYNNVDELKKYFESLVSEEIFLVRSALLEVKIAGHKPTIFCYDSDLEKLFEARY